MRDIETFFKLTEFTGTQQWKDEMHQRRTYHRRWALIWAGLFCLDIVVSVEWLIGLPTLVFAKHDPGPFIGINIWFWPIAVVAVFTVYCYCKSNQHLDQIP